MSALQQSLFSRDVLQTGPFFRDAGVVGYGSGSAIPGLPVYEVDDTLLMVYTGVTAAATPSGWTVITAGVAGPFYQTLYRKKAATGEVAPTLTSSSASSAVILSYGNTPNANPVSAQSARVDTGGVTSIATATFATGTANTIVVSVFSIPGDSVTRTWTAPGSTTIRIDYQAPNGDDLPILIVDEVKAVSGTTTARTASVTSLATNMCAFALALKST